MRQKELMSQKKLARDAGDEVEMRETMLNPHVKTEAKAESIWAKKFLTHESNWVKKLSQFWEKITKQESEASS